MPTERPTRVTLRRGVARNPVIYNDSNPTRARARAFAMAELHAAEPVIESGQWVVDAAEFYDGGSSDAG